MEKEVEAHLYRTSNMKPNDYAFTWCGKLPCKYIPVVGTNESHIRIENWDSFFASLNDFSKDHYLSYHPVIFWKIPSDRIQGMIEISKIPCFL